MRDIFVTYPGSKSGSGVYQKLINQMPPHHAYIEAFLGGGAVMRSKKPAVVNIGIDMNGAVVEAWQANPPAEIPNLTILQQNSVLWLNAHAAELGQDTLVYCDPPYLMETRSCQKQLYTFEMADAEEHILLLDLLRGLPCMVMISGYWSALYAKKLADWRSFSFQAMTRSGKTATEWVWMNFPEPFTLHDYRYLGDTFRDRERIKRKKTRWIERLKNMDALERMALLDVIGELGSSASHDVASGG